MDKLVNLSGENLVLKEAFYEEYKKFIEEGLSYEEIKVSLESTASDIVNGIVKEYIENWGLYSQKDIDGLYKIIYGALEGWLWEFRGIKV